MRTNSRHALDHGLFYRFFACARGATAVEFTIVISVYLLLLFGIFEIGRAISTQNALERFTSELVRQSFIHGCDVFDNFETLSPPAALDITEIETVFIDGTLSVSYPVTLIIPFVDFSNLTLSVSREIGSLCEPANT